MTTPDSVAERLCEPAERPTRTYWGRFATFMFISVVIASLGLYRNSGALVIAGMLLAPLMTPIVGTAAALVKGWTVRLLRMAAFVIVATVATIATAFVLFVLLEAWSSPARCSRGQTPGSRSFWWPWPRASPAPTPSCARGS